MGKLIDIILLLFKLLYIIPVRFAMYTLEPQEDTIEQETWESH